VRSATHSDASTAVENTTTTAAADDAVGCSDDAVT
jgi:hypothetical protein